MQNYSFHCESFYSNSVGVDVIFNSQTHIVTCDCEVNKLLRIVGPLILCMCLWSPFYVFLESLFIIGYVFVSLWVESLLCVCQIALLCICEVLFLCLWSPPYMFVESSLCVCWVPLTYFCSPSYVFVESPLNACGSQWYICGVLLICLWSPPGGGSMQLVYSCTLPGKEREGPHLNLHPVIVNLTTCFEIMSGVKIVIFYIGISNFCIRM